MQRSVRPLRLRDTHVAADLSHKEIVDFSVPRYCRGLIVGRIELHTVLPTLAEQATAVRFHVANQVLTLHVNVGSNGSRDTA